MIRIIGCKRYNTETAVSIANWSNMIDETDFCHVKETLYRTKKGAYFLHRYGGQWSKYREDMGTKGFGSGEDIIPCSEDEAIQWLEKHGLADEIESEFGDRIEDA